MPGKQIALQTQSAVQLTANGKTADTGSGMLEQDTQTICQVTGGTEQRNADAKNCTADSTDRQTADARNSMLNRTHIHTHKEC